MRNRWLIAALVACSGLTGASVALATGAGPCVIAAKDLFVECQRGCKEGYQESKDGCFNRDHACVEVCREERHQCVVDSGRPADIAACNLIRDGAIQNCKNLYGPGTADRDQCVDNAQVDAFVCRDTARENNAAEVGVCRQGFKACAKACAPADPPFDALGCKTQAKADYKTCKQDCREDFQLSKDICRGLGHACVEVCRDLRQTCVGNLGLDAAIALCDATKAAAAQVCRNTYPAGDARDQCIDQVQVVAFQCRDQAREDAQPGVALCRDAFRACIHPACEGASPSGSFLD